MTDTDWQAALDAFEDRLATQWDVYRAGLAEPVPPFAPPAVTSPVPPAFADRARELLARCRALEETLAAALEMARSDLDRLEASATATMPAQPMYFDSKV